MTHECSMEYATVWHLSNSAVRFWIFINSRLSQHYRPTHLCIMLKRQSSPLYNHHRNASNRFHFSYRTQNKCLYVTGNWQVLIREQNWYTSHCHPKLLSLFSTPFTSIMWVYRQRYQECALAKAGWAQGFLCRAWCKALTQSINHPSPSHGNGQAAARANVNGLLSLPT